MFENGRAENIVVHVDHLQKEEFECVFAHMLSLVFVPTKSSESEFANTCAHIVQVVFRVRCVRVTVCQAPSVCLSSHVAPVTPKLHLRRRH